MVISGHNLVPVAEEGDDEHHDEEGEEYPNDDTGVADCLIGLLVAVVHADQRLVRGVCVVVGSHVEVIYQEQRTRVYDSH